MNATLGYKSRPLARGSHGAVAAGHPLAAAVGISLLEDGGNAVDAAAATAFASMVLLPEACGLGGDAFFLHRDPSGASVAYNGSGRSPTGLAGPVPNDGAGAAAVPGAVAALAAAVERAGRTSFARIVEPAAILAEEGFPIGEYLLAVIARQASRLRRGAPGRRCSTLTFGPERGSGSLASLRSCARSVSTDRGRSTMVRLLPRYNGSRKPKAARFEQGICNSMRQSSRNR